MRSTRLLGLAVCVLVFAPSAALATNGYFSHGYGMKSKGMGGASTALSLDSMGAATNPASMAFVPYRFDVGVDYFSPKREAKREGAGIGAYGMDWGPAINGSNKSGANQFYMPEVGYNHPLNGAFTAGFTMYGNGGLDTSYSSEGIGGMPGAVGKNLLGGYGKLGVHLEQMILAPGATYKVVPDHAFGVTPLIGYQRFSAEGLSLFSTASRTTDPVWGKDKNFTNQGTDSSFGYGVRVGYLGKINSMVSVGAAWSSRIYMSKFKKYEGLFAEQGAFDIPANLSAGVAVTPIRGLTASADFARIMYNGIRSVSNPNPSQDMSAKLGDDNGAGFGWTDQNVYKIGLQYKGFVEGLSLRAGFNYGKAPLDGGDVTFGILAPATIEKHLTAGASYEWGVHEVTASYMHAYENSIKGSSVLAGSFQTSATETIKMYEDSFGIAYGMKL